MGSFSSFSYTSRITFWPVTLDEYAQPTYGVPYTLNGTWIKDQSAQRQDMAVEFVPNSTIYCEGELAQLPLEQMKVSDGEFVGAPPDSAELIRSVKTFDNSLFQAGTLYDFVVMT